MNKKILSGVLAAASMLSFSVAASAAATPPATPAPTTESYSGGKTYNVSAIVSYGTVDVTVPVALNNVIINPYGAAVQTTLADGTTKIANRSAIASEVYTIKNNDATDGIKVMATVSVTKATGVVVKDMSLTAASVKGNDAVGANVCDAVANFNPLVDYTAITTVVDKTDPTNPVTTYSKGGDKAAASAQKKNIAVRVYGIAGGDADAGTVLPTYKTNNTTGAVTKTAPKNASVINFLPKGAVTDTLGKAEASQNVFFTLDGDLNPELGNDAAWGTENLTLSIVLKVLPVVADV